MIPEDFKSLLPKVAAEVPHGVDHPTHYLWVFDPESGRVHVEHNKDRHPKDAVDHSHLAARVSHPDRVHGYAYRIHGGYRITDWDHNEVKDPYIKEQVRRALRGQQPQEHVGSVAQSRALT